LLLRSENKNNGEKHNEVSHANWGQVTNGPQGPVNSKRVTKPQGKLGLQD